jgi:predicted AAA+ superfamily ATPase
LVAPAPGFQSDGMSVNLIIASLARASRREFLENQESDSYFSRMFIERKAYEHQIRDSLQRSRITALFGPRQCGKTTLAKRFVTSSESYFDLEDPVDLARLGTPRQTLSRLTGFGGH